MHFNRKYRSLQSPPSHRSIRLITLNNSLKLLAHSHHLPTPPPHPMTPSNLLMCLSVYMAPCLKRLSFTSGIHSRACVYQNFFSIVSDSLRPHGLQPTRLLHPQDFPGKRTGVGCHFLLQGIFLTQGSNPGLPHCRQTLYHLSHQGNLWRYYSLPILP